MDKPSQQLAINSGPATQHISAVSRITTASAVHPPSYFDIVIHITGRRAIKSATATKGSKRNSNNSSRRAHIISNKSSSNPEQELPPPTEPASQSR
ncbi:hypothetical protein Nepgr_007928 [Nepenthes gracilis]|uniref:Uncharacterized protein n=1 Tax=Nepenthes gracilis TaxID=150966 RepID=A0AAD3XIS0_NEPGR|nr:hypothetical protein Nepgr_007928 [Nepenthes gracilis]